MPIVIVTKSLLRAQSEHGVPPFRRGNERCFAASRNLNAEKTRAPKRAARRVSTLRLFRINNLAAVATIIGKQGMIAFEDEAEAREHFTFGDLITIGGSGPAIILELSFVYRMFVAAKVNRWAQLEADTFVVREKPVTDMNRVLAVKEKDVFFDYNAVQFVSPNRQMIFQPELFNHRAAARIERTIVCATQFDAFAVRQADAFTEVIEHHHAAEGFWKRGDEKAVVSPAYRTRNGAGSVTAEAVCDQPFAAQQ